MSTLRADKGEKAETIGAKAAREIMRKTDNQDGFLLMECEIAGVIDTEIALGEQVEAREQTEGATVFGSLRAANVARQADWCPEQIPDLSFRGNELAGETGEVCNVIKKLERQRLNWRGSRDTKEHLAEELADVVICADLIGIASGIDLERAVIDKFNATSEKVGLPQRMPLPAGAPEKKEERK